MTILDIHMICFFIFNHYFSRKSEIDVDRLLADCLLFHKPKEIFFFNWYETSGLFIQNSQ